MHPSRSLPEQAIDSVDPIANPMFNDEGTRRRPVAKHRYVWAGQEAFAALSGDFNPLHLDRTVARREFFGDIVVHGMHGLLRALDAWCATQPAPMQLTRLRANFPNPAFLEALVETEEAERGDGWVRLAATSGGLPTLHAELRWVAPATRPPGQDAHSDGTGSPLPSAPTELILRAEEHDFEQLRDCSGDLPLWLDEVAARRLFPNILATLPPLQLAELLALTRLVGMHCPGLRSIFSGFQVEFLSPAAPTAPWLRYRVQRTVRGASFVQLCLSGSNASGSVDVFYRPAPQPQPSFEAVRKRIQDGEFARQSALVVGGSRGLGEVSAKLIAAGGGRVAITYHRGREDAERVAASIRAGGRTCDVVGCDIESPGNLATELQRRDFVPTHLYYFASPKIFVKRGSGYDQALYSRFQGAYVGGFEALCRVCQQVGARQLRAFYPSSTALDENVKNLEEYVAAKRAGEEKCVELMQTDPTLEILVQRLPRIATDQTTTLRHHPAADALDVMVDIVRQMNACRGA